MNNVEKIIYKCLKFCLEVVVIVSMRFCDVMVEVLKKLSEPEFKNFLKDFNKKLEKSLGLKDSMMYIIGCGSNFQFLFNCDYDHALEEYHKMDIFYCTGTLADKVTAYHSMIEKYHCMESNSGYVHCFILPIDSMKDLNIHLIEEKAE